MYLTNLVDYLIELKANNNRAWFEANRQQYDGLRARFMELTDGIIGKCRAFDGELAGATAKSCVFRINRDIRFSSDKSPYKTQFSAVISSATGQKEYTSGGYYYSVSWDDSLMIGAGSWQPPSEALTKIRESISRDGKRFASIVNDPVTARSFGEFEGDPLKSMPRGYSADHPYAQYLRYRSFTVGHTEQASSLPDDKIAGHIAGLMRHAYPLVSYLREVVAS